GPETKESRDLLRETVTRVVSQIWPEEGASASPASPQSAGGEVHYDKIQALSPKNDAQRSLQSQALSIVMDTGKPTAAHVRAMDPSGFYSAIGRAGPVVDRHFHQLWPLRAFQRDRCFQFVRFCTLSFRSNFLDSGYVHALYGSDGDFRRPAAHSPGATRPVLAL